MRGHQALGPSAGLLLVGFGQRDITPTPGMPMDGYAAREGPAMGRLDSLHVRVCVLESVERRAILVLLDVLGVGQGFVEDVREAVVETGMRKRTTLIVAATHTHSGPVGLVDTSLKSQRVRAYKATVLESIGEAIREAAAQLTSVTTHFAQRHTEKIVAHRNNPDIAIDDSVRTLAFTSRASGRLVGTVANFACHPTVLPADNLLYSADLHGNAASFAAVKLGAPCLLFNGAEGDLSTRFTRTSQDPRELEHLATALAATISSSARAAIGAPEFAAGAGPAPGRETLAVAHTVVTLPQRSVPTVEEAEELMLSAQRELDSVTARGEGMPAVRMATTRLQGAEALLDRARKGVRSSETRIELTGIRVGSAIIVAVPGELSSSALDSHGLSQEADLLIVGLANGYIGYLPERQAYVDGTYEALRTSVAPEATDRVVAAIASLYRRLGTTNA